MNKESLSEIRKRAEDGPPGGWIETNGPGSYFIVQLQRDHKALILALESAMKVIEAARCVADRNYAMSRQGSPSLIEALAAFDEATNGKL